MNLLSNNIELICRICLKSGLDFHDIFTKNESSYTIAYLLMECAPVEIAPEDGLPHQICTDCFEKVQYVQVFKNQIITSDTTLRQYFKNDGDIKPNVWLLHGADDFEKEEVKSDVSVGFPDEVEAVEVKEESSKDINEKNNITLVNSVKLKPPKKTSKKQTKKRLKNESEVKKSQVNEIKTIEFKCDVCKRTCSTKGNLALHQRIHTGERPHICDFCGKSYRSGSCLVKHRRTHTGEYPYQCDICSKRFVYSTDFKNHKYIHSSERLFKCNKCEKSFKQKSQLRGHKSIHSDIYNFKCDTCHKQFRTKTVLKNHIRIHTGEQPYKCDLCSKNFSHSASLYNHNRLVHKIKSKKSSTTEENNKTKIEDKSLPLLDST